MSPTDSMKELPFPRAAPAALSAKPSEIEREVMELFEQFRDPASPLCTLVWHSCA